MSVPVFIDITVETQAEELKNYLKEKGADISEELSSKGVEEDLAEIINVCDVIYQEETSEQDVEAVFNSIVSMLVMLPGDSSEELVTNFCKKVSLAPSASLKVTALRVLNLVFHGLDKHCPMRYLVYRYLVDIAGETDQVESIFTDVNSLKSTLSEASPPPNNEQMQELFRLLHKALVRNGHGDLAFKVMVELLKTYTPENASQAKEDAKYCIVASLADPNTFVLDHLLDLMPVKSLEGTLIFDLLLIFVCEKLEKYMQFYSKHKDFIESLNLKHEDLVKKMRFLTFLQMAESEDEISFDSIQKELQIPEDEVEQYIIDALRTKLIRARMDQLTKKVMVSNCMHRTFGRPQWQQLRKVLHTWRDSLAAIQGNMEALVSAQMDMIQSQG